jgi:membrane-associated phospholipid phosphatase
MDYIGNNDFSKTAKWFYLAGSHALAAYVGYTRVIDNRHFVSDVIAGGIVGSTIALLVYSYQNKILNQTDTGNVSLTVLPSHLSLIIHF